MNSLPKKVLYMKFAFHSSAKKSGGHRQQIIILASLDSIIILPAFVGSENEHKTISGCFNEVWRVTKEV